MQKAYIYPISNRLKSGVYNPYIDNFVRYGSKYYSFVNEAYPSNTGVFDILKYISKVDIIFFNWIEKLPELKGGLIQMTFLFMLLKYCKLKKIKVVWTVHNKIAHSNQHLFFKKMIFNRMINESDLLITHSSEGVILINELLKRSKSIYFFPHPVVQNQLNKASGKEYDILMWGSLSKYKGIDLFLDFLHNNDLDEKYSIKIVGKCSDDEYYKKLLSLTNGNISIENRFLENDELNKLIASARIVLFTYNSDSVLSSGALAETLSYGAPVVGPYKGSFKDLADLNYIFTFETYDSLMMLLDSMLNGKQKISEDMYAQFLRDYHWSVFADKMYQEINQLN